MVSEEIEPKILVGCVVEYLRKEIEQKKEKFGKVFETR